MTRQITASGLDLLPQAEGGALTPAAERPSQLQVRQAMPPVLPPGRNAPRRRFPWLAVTFFLAVIVPTIGAGIYLYGYSTDQYVSEFRFRLRHAQPSRLENTSALGGLTGAGAALETMTDSEIVVQYLQSRQVIDDMKPGIDLDSIYGTETADWWARLPAGDAIEDKLKYWRSMVEPFYDTSTGVVTVKVRAFDRADAQRVSAAMLESAETLVNHLSVRAQEAKLTYARQGVEEKLVAWKKAEKSLEAFRNANQVVLPNIQASESSRLDGALRASESRARSALEALRLQGMSDNSPQARAIRAQLASITAEIKRTQTQQTRNDPADAAPLRPATTEPAQSFATVLTTYEGLDVDAKIAAKAYELATMAEQRARDEANQQQIYLDAFVTPAVAERSLYPLRWRLMLQVGFGALAAWCLVVLLWRGVMDHLD